MNIATTAPTMSTREIAELTGKTVSHVNRDAEAMISEVKLAAIDAADHDPDLDHVEFERDGRGYAVAIHLPRRYVQPSAAECSTHRME